MKTIRIGVIGAGANTRKMHLPGFQKIPGVEVTRVCNRSEESSRKVASEFGIPQVASHWRELVEASDVDAVMIGTWPYLHAEATVAALDCGKHVLTEARMARNLAEALTMREASRRNPGLVAQIVPAPMSLEVDASVRKVLSSGELGQLREVCVTHTGGQFVSADSPLSWRQDFDLSGYNVLSMGIYHEMVQRWLGQEPVWVMADAAVFTARREDAASGALVEVRIPESLSILGRFPEDVRLIYHFSGVEGGAARNEMRINASRGTLRFDVAGNRLFRSLGGPEQEVAISPEERRGWRVEADFIDSIRTGAPVKLTSFDDGVKYMRFTEAVYHSWRSLSRVDLQGEGDR
jgi:predicted dehydrogenase